jgi:hypothetical protein
MTFDPTKEGAVEVFNPADEGAVAITPRDINPVAAEEKAEKMWDISTKQQVPLSVQENLPKLEDIQKRHDKVVDFTKHPFFGVDLTPELMSEILKLPKERKVTPFRPLRTLEEIPKGVLRFAESQVLGFPGRVVDWLGQFIEFGGAAVQKFSALGSKDEDRIYNPYAESIVASGHGISRFGKESRDYMVWHATHGWEAFDERLRETDPISYGAGRLSEGVASSALAVLAAYLSGGVSAQIDTAFRLNRGLAALSMLSAAGGFEHARNQDENFLWATAHGLADGMIEYAMESSFLEGIADSSRLAVGAKEGIEEFFTGMMQNTRASILENSNKGMSAYEASKEAIVSSLRQSPWDVTAGFLGGYGIAGGRDLKSLVKRGLAAEAKPVEVEAEPTAEQIKAKEAAKIKKLTDKAVEELGKAKKPREIIEVEKTAELGKRAARSAQAAEIAEGAGRLSAALGELRGPLTEYKSPDFTPLKETMTTKETDALHNDIWQRPHNPDHFSKINTAKAWSKVVEGFIPTRGEILLLEKQWGKEFSKGLLKKRPLGDKAWDTAADVSNFMRTMIAGGDVSVAGRQLRVLGQRYPVEFGAAVKKGLGAYRSEKLSEIMRQEYESSEYHREAKKYVQFFDPAGTEATPPSERPEWYVSHYPERVPILGHLIRMGNRNYVETMNSFTQAIWDKLRAQDIANGIEPTAEQLALRGKWLMSMTGRPEIGGVVGRRLAPIAAGFFFAPRFAVSRFTSPMYLRHLATGDPVAREVGRNTAISFASFIGTNIAILSLLKLKFGDDFEVELDPRSPDWGKGKMGNTRVDLWAGYQQAARFLVQMTLAQYKTQTGRIKETERLETIGRFIRGKENPLVSLISDLWAGKTYEGDRPFSPPEGEMGKILDALQVPKLIQGVGKEAYRRMLFMWAQDFVEASANDGWPIGFTAGALSFFGTNTSSYEDTAFTKKAKFKDNIAQTEHGKNWDELNSSQQKRLSRIHKQEIFELGLQAKKEGARRDDYDYVARLIEDEKKAGKKVYKKLKPENQKLLDDAGISLGLSRKIGDWEIDDTRYEQYQEFTSEILDDKLSRLPDISDIPIKRRVTKIELIVQTAKDKAKGKVRRAARAE